MGADDKSGARKNIGRGDFMKNSMKMQFDAVGENESFARLAVAAFVMALDPTVEELSYINTALSE